MPLNIKNLGISSPDITTGERIPDTYAASNGNKVPAVTIHGVPDDAVELAVIAHDPDAPLPQGFTHWVLYGLRPEEGQVCDGRPGPNSLGEKSYFGPQPPPGHGLHHYYFWVYALDRPVTGEPTREKFLRQYADNIVEQNRFVATYSS